MNDQLIISTDEEMHLEEVIKRSDETKLIISPDAINFGSKYAKGFP